MHSSRFTARAFLTAAALLLATSIVHAGKLTVPYPDPALGLVKSATRGGSPLAKLSPELLLLYKQYTDALPAYTPAQLRARFGITGQAANPRVSIALHLSGSPDIAAVENSGAAVYSQSGNTLYAGAPLLSLKTLAQNSVVAKIAPIRPGSFPMPPGRSRFALRKRMTTRGGDDAPANEFDHAGLSGKGVIVGIVDTGIDWRHADFIRPDGTSRIVALWDMTDDSWTTSHGKIGSEPPVHDDKHALGTLYTHAQIQAALKGDGKVNSHDTDGHGTACAGTAAGGGRPSEKGGALYPGVAPDADLVIVKAGETAANPFYYLGTAFIIDTAATLHQPCVISQSFGSQDTAHDGSTPEEQKMDALCGPGKPGVAICVSGGNDGLYSLHASGRFGPKQTGQADIESETVQLFVTAPTELDAYLSDSDDWGLAIVGLDNFLVDKKGNPDILYITHEPTGIRGSMKAPFKAPENFSKFFNQVQTEKVANDQEDRIMTPLQPGQYLVMAFGTTEHVQNGRFHLYLPFPDDASFGAGADKENMVSTPGNAANVITVGAYNFRKSWPNALNGTTSYNLPLGDLAEYSSPGFRRDGQIKPEIVAPASYTISSLASGSSMGQDDNGKPQQAMITPDGTHVAWAGTSAAAPYTAGVIALMLQKNPNLDSAQIKQILIKSAIQDAFTGALPNHQWGYGKLNPSAALAATPAP